MKTFLRPTQLLIAAAIFHLLVSTTITMLGRYQLMPAVFDHNGIALGIASDGVKIREETIRRSEELERAEFRTWFRAHSPFYVKLHSISFASVGIVFGTNVLSLEPVNLACYLIILALVFHLARESTNQTFAIVAAAVVALWPSFLLHTTQLLKDPLFVAAMLAFVLVNVRVLSRKLSWRSAALSAVAGGIAAILVWLARDTMGEILIAAPLLAVVLMLIRLLVGSRHRQELMPSLAALILIAVFSFAASRLIPEFERRVTGADTWEESRRPAPEPQPQTIAADGASRFVARIAKSRRQFASEFADAGSNVDINVSLTSIGDVVRYLPRAAMIGFLAPFPNMWFASGRQVSRNGRLLSGIEMIMTYLIEVLALLELWVGRRGISTWFLALVSAMGLVSLGLVVPNIGALYRLRYVFVILLIVLATEGAQIVLQYFKQSPITTTPQS